jgi:hypothetical protein
MGNSISMLTLAMPTVSLLLPYQIALLHAKRGESNEAFNGLNRAHDHHTWVFLS